ncbi:MAG: AAA family ATPase [Eubacteriales bacterium]|nr:AAA family ATPase [Eubacteriales bacterium]
MNIKEAKEELKNIVLAYLAKDETGMPRISEEHRRPVLLMGPPGIGKTAIMEQIAKELKINLVSYTITHHTRQSAIGLPGIVHRSFDGVDYAVTEYTMSEIIASVYEQIERSGVKEGILFLDEINCVSETLAPTMLQFLQYKTFGTHKVPDGFIIVTAGNPPEYNQSVREFDIVTLDRLRRIDIDADYNAFREYAFRAKVHGSIMAYLEIRKDRFYKVEADTDRKRFVTARGWEDLSEAIKTYEALKLPVSKELMSQYLQDEEIASDFAVYYELYRKYESFYRIPEILSGEAWIDDSLRHAPFDEKLSLIGLLIDALNAEFRDYRDRQALGEGLLEVLKEYAAELKKLRSAGKDAAAADVLHDIIAAKAAERERLKNAGMLTREAEADLLRMEKSLSKLHTELLEKGLGGSAGEAFAYAKEWFNAIEEARQEAIKTTDEHLTNAFKALNQTFPQGQEMVIFLSELNAGYYSLKFVNECGNETYFHYNKLLLLKDRSDSLRQDILRLTEGI